MIFLAAVLHETKAPIVNLIWIIQLVHKPHEDPETQNRLVPMDGGVGLNL